MNTSLQEIVTPPSLPDELPGNSDREQWIRRYRLVRAFTEELCKPLKPEDYVIQSMPDASPAKWHLAHTSWFFETFILLPGLPDYRKSAEENAYLFNSYYNAVGPMHCRARRGMISRPTVEETYRYRAQIDEAMTDFLETVPAPRWRQMQPILLLGLNHEQQHQELIVTDVKHMLAQNPLYPSYRANQTALSTNSVDGSRPTRGNTKSSQTQTPLRWLTFPEGLYQIGKEPDEEFVFDNETPRHREFLEEFQLGSRLVTNREYLEFMEDGGYQRPEFWLSLGWFTVSEQKWKAPLYWEEEDNEWFVFTLNGQSHVNLDEPVCHISYFEADAYVRWAGARLPTEAEWEVASAKAPLKGNFAETKEFNPVRAGFDQNQKAAPLQMFGDVWEWTRSSYAPYPRYEPAKGALGEYNGKFMCNQYVLRGGSCATSQTHIRRSYRNFFAPDKRWQFMGIRLAKDTL